METIKQAELLRLELVYSRKAARRIIDDIIESLRLGEYDKAKHSCLVLIATLERLTNTDNKLADLE